MAGEEDWLGWIGKELGGFLIGGRSQLLLYLEMYDGSSSGAIFVDEGSDIAYHAIDRELWPKLYDDWCDLPDEKLWAVMQYRLFTDGSFTAFFKFPNEIDVSDMDVGGARETAAARETFGDKPIHYPPEPEHAFDLSGQPRGFDAPLG